MTGGKQDSKDEYYMKICATYKEYEIAYKKDIDTLKQSVNVFKQRDIQISEENRKLKSEIDPLYLQVARLQEEIRTLWKALQDQKIRNIADNARMEDYKKRLDQEFNTKATVINVFKQHHEELYEDTRHNELAALKTRELALQYMTKEQQLDFVDKMTKDEHMKTFSSIEELKKSNKVEALYYIDNNNK